MVYTSFKKSLHLMTSKMLCSVTIKNMLVYISKVKNIILYIYAHITTISLRILHILQFWLHPITFYFVDKSLNINKEKISFDHFFLIVKIIPNYVIRFKECIFFS